MSIRSLHTCFCVQVLEDEVSGSIWILVSVSLDQWHGLNGTSCHIMLPNMSKISKCQEKSSWYYTCVWILGGEIVSLRLSQAWTCTGESHGSLLSQRLHIWGLSSQGVGGLKCGERPAPPCSSGRFIERVFAPSRGRGLEMSRDVRSVCQEPHVWTEPRCCFYLSKQKKNMRRRQRSSARCQFRSLLTHNVTGALVNIFTEADYCMSINMSLCPGLTGFHQNLMTFVFLSNLKSTF